MQRLGHLSLVFFLLFVGVVFVGPALSQSCPVSSQKETITWLKVTSQGDIFTLQEDNGSYFLFVQQSETLHSASPQQLSPCAIDSPLQYPVLSPDEQNLLFFCNSSVLLYNIASGVTTNVSSNSVLQYTCRGETYAWSPTSTFFVFAQQNSNSFNSSLWSYTLYRVDATSGNATQVNNAPIPNGQQGINFKITPSGGSVIVHQLGTATLLSFNLTTTLLPPVQLFPPPPGPPPPPPIQDFEINPSGTAITLYSSSLNPPIQLFTFTLPPNGTTIHTTLSGSSGFQFLDYINDYQFAFIETQGGGSYYYINQNPFSGQIIQRISILNATHLPSDQPTFLLLENFQGLFFTALEDLYYVDLVSNNYAPVLVDFCLPGSHLSLLLQTSTFEVLLQLEDANFFYRYVLARVDPSTLSAPPPPTASASIWLQRVTSSPGVSNNTIYFADTNVVLDSPLDLVRLSGSVGRDQNCGTRIPFNTTDRFVQQNSNDTITVKYASATSGPPAVNFARPPPKLNVTTAQTDITFTSIKEVDAEGNTVFDFGVSTTDSTQVISPDQTTVQYSYLFGRNGTITSTVFTFTTFTTNTTVSFGGVEIPVTPETLKWEVSSLCLELENATNQLSVTFEVKASQNFSLVQNTSQTDEIQSLQFNNSQGFSLNIDYPRFALAVEEQSDITTDIKLVDGYISFTILLPARDNPNRCIFGGKPDIVYDPTLSLLYDSSPSTTSSSSSSGDGSGIGGGGDGTIYGIILPVVLVPLAALVVAGVIGGVIVVKLLQRKRRMTINIEDSINL